MTRVAIYARSAIENPAVIKLQIQECEARIREEGWEHVRTYADLGKSGRAAERPELAALVHDCEDQFDLVIAVDVSRFTRNATDWAEFAGLISTRGGQVYTLKAGLHDDEGKIVCFDPSRIPASAYSPREGDSK